MGIWDGSGISWSICKQSAPRSRQVTTPTPHHSIFTGWVLFVTPIQQCQSTNTKQTRSIWIVFKYQNENRYLIFYLTTILSVFFTAFSALMLPLWLQFEPGPFCIWVQHANHLATEPHTMLTQVVKQVCVFVIISYSTENSASVSYNLTGSCCSSAVPAEFLSRSENPHRRCDVASSKRRLLDHHTMSWPGQTCHTATGCDESSSANQI